jgi:uncharacterized protein DUF2785
MRLPENKVTALLTTALLLSFGSQAKGASVDCLDTRTALEYWRPIREQAPTTRAPADSLAVALVACLKSPNSELRDEIAYELFTYWLRSDRLADNTRRALLRDLTGTMSRPPAARPDNSSLDRSFSALVLSELMRSDAQKPFMTGEERDVLLDNAIAALGRENDFRGLDAELGWVHPVAHMSDLLWRFALHPDTSSTQAELILIAVGSKIAPDGAIYSFNEGDRLARIVTTIARRKIVDAELVARWISSFETPQSMEKWSDAFQSPAGMSELHNTKQFLRALSDQLAGSGLDPRILEPLAELVDGFTQLI